MAGSGERLDETRDWRLRVQRTQEGARREGVTLVQLADLEDAQRLAYQA